MSELRAFSKGFWVDTIQKIWDGILQNLPVVLITTFGSAAVVIGNTIDSVRSYVRQIPTDFILVPCLIFIFISIALAVIYFKQKKRIIELTSAPSEATKPSIFVSHFGLWWKIYPRGEYVEDMPYCVCCSPHIKLVQIEWHPDEEFKCPITKTKYKIYDGVPRALQETVVAIRDAYFHGLGDDFISFCNKEIIRLKQLNPEISDKEISLKIFSVAPLNRIPDEERKQIIDRIENPYNAVQFVDQNFHKYSEYIRLIPEELDNIN